MNRKKLKSVKLVFENCDSATIEAKDIQSLWYKIDCKYVDWQHHNTYVWEGNYSPYFFLKIFNLKALQYATEFSHDGKPKSLFNRLSYPDITSVVINFEDDTSEHFGIPFKKRDGWGYSSIYQRLSKAKKELFLAENGVWEEKEVWLLDISKTHLLSKYIRWYVHRMLHPVIWYKSIKHGIYYNYYITRLIVVVSNFVYDLKSKKNNRSI